MGRASRVPMTSGRARRGKSVIEPAETLDYVGFRTLAQHLMEDVPGNAVGVVDVPDVTGLERHARRAQVARGHEATERLLEIARRSIDELGETHAILDRHARALRQRLQRGMRGVAEQHRPALVPMPDRVAVADR